MKTKIILTGLILLLTIGIVTATDVDNFKPAPYFGDFQSGQSINQIDSKIQMMVSSFMAEDFETNDDFEVTELENNTYKSVDKLTGDVCILEKINKDGKDYSVLIYGNEDDETLLGYLNQFNKENNV